MESLAMTKPRQTRPGEMAMTHATTTELPRILDKASDDNWHFLVKTKTGDKFIFGSIDVCGDWIHLNPLDDAYMDGPLPFDSADSDGAVRVDQRGLDLRLDAIEWIADGIS
jgi:hypothetical protein